MAYQYSPEEVVSYLRKSADLLREVALALDSTTLSYAAKGIVRSSLINSQISHLIVDQLEEELKVTAADQHVNPCTLPPSNSF